MSIPIQFKRGTRAQVDALGSQGGFLPGEPLFITDEKRTVIADSSTTYASPVLFTAYLNATQNVGVNNPLTSWTVLTNVGGGGLDAGGTYTVPRSGYYNLQISLLLDPSVASGSLAFRINSTNRLRVAYAANSSPMYDMAVGQEFVLLNAGDLVNVINTESGVWFGNAGSPVGRWNIQYVN